MESLIRTQLCRGEFRNARQSLGKTDTQQSQWHGKSYERNRIVDIIKIVDYLKKIIKTRQEQVNDVISKGVKDFEEYKYLLGKLHAYNEIIQELTDLLKKQEHYDEDDFTKT